MASFSSFSSKRLSSNGGGLTSAHPVAIVDDGSSEEEEMGLCAGEICVSETAKMVMSIQRGGQTTARMSL